MNAYKKGKERLQLKAIEWQLSQTYYEKGYSWGEIAEIQAYFEKQAKRYGLLKEFRENGII